MPSDMSEALNNEVLCFATPILFNKIGYGVKTPIAVTFDAKEKVHSADKAKAGLGELNAEESFRME